MARTASQTAHGLGFSIFKTSVYATVLLPVPLMGTFTYSIPQGMIVSPGCRVLVPFGKSKFYTGIVTGFTTTAPDARSLKDIDSVLDLEPILRHPQLKFWQWLADYYLCTPGEVYRAAVPSGLKIESETVLCLNSEWEPVPLSSQQQALVEALIASDKPLTTQALLKAAPHRTALSQLIAMGAVMVSEKMVERYHARSETYVMLTSMDISEAFQAVSTAPKQEKALLALMELGGRENRKPVLRSALMERAGVTPAILSAMAQKGILEMERRQVSRFSYSGQVTHALPSLTEAQDKALDAIHKSWLRQPVTLLHGVTSSGKTEIYMHLAQRVLEMKRQVLYLVPEIALTTQLTQRLQRVFGDKVLIYHSKFSDNERVEIWRKMLNDNEPRIIIGARSSVFLPFAHLGLVIVDEEHESSYKQQDPAPRYNARDAAIVLATMHGAKTLLGSATPSVETYFKACNGKYGLVTLSERFQGASLPQVEIIDMSDARKRGEVDGTFSRKLQARVREELGSGRQAILFLNRRGYAPFALCRRCGFVPRCENCDVSLTYHRAIDRLVCHYCGTPYTLPKTCPACQEAGLEIVGYGTERVHDEVQGLFPHARIARMDLDTTRNKEGYQSLIDSFSKGKDDILVGTQMVTKGLDFAGVGVVGVVNADAMINQPDFRSAERAFCMMEQVSGRAGRRAGQSGTVEVQTHSPSHPIFKHLLRHDYQGFYQEELEQRQQFCYPPYSRIVYVYLKHRDRQTVSEAACKLSQRLAQLLGQRVSQADEPPVSRVQNLHIRRIMVKLETDISMTRVKQLLRQVQVDMVNEGTLKGIILYYDVDPS